MVKKIFFFYIIINLFNYLYANPYKILVTINNNPITKIPIDYSVVGMFLLNLTVKQADEVIVFCVGGGLTPLKEYYFTRKGVEKNEIVESDTNITNLPIWNVYDNKLNEVRWYLSSEPDTFYRKKEDGSIDYSKFVYKDGKILVNHKNIQFIVMPIIKITKGGSVKNNKKSRKQSHHKSNKKISKSNKKKSKSNKKISKSIKKKSKSK